ncbi:MAG: hypothetical protein WCR72_02475 [Bacteroidota bacterium]
MQELTGTIEVPANKNDSTPCHAHGYMPNRHLPFGGCNRNESEELNEPFNLILKTEFMKSPKIIFVNILIASGFLFLSCDKTTTDDEKTCGNSANLDWDNLHAEFFSLDFGTALFRISVDASNICIYKNAEITIHIGETQASSIISVNAFAILPSSTPPDFFFEHQSEVPAVWSSNPYSLNLQQSFTSNPGNFNILIYIYVPATTQAEAQQKYDASVDLARSYIDVLYYRVKS